MLRSPVMPVINLQMIFQKISDYQEGTGFTDTDAQFLHGFFNDPSFINHRQALRSALIQRFGDKVNDHLKMVATDVLDSLWKPNNFSFFNELDAAARLRQNNKALQERLDTQHQAITQLSEQHALKDQAIAQHQKQNQKLTNKLATQQLNISLTQMKLKTSDDIVNSLSDKIAMLQIENKTLTLEQEKRFAKSGVKIYTLQEMQGQMSDYRNTNARLVTRNLQLHATLLDLKNQIKVLKEMASQVDTPKILKIEQPEEPIESSEKVMQNLQNKMVAFQKEKANTLKSDTKAPVVTQGEIQQMIRAGEAWIALARTIKPTDDPSGHKVRTILIKMLDSLAANLKSSTDPQHIIFNHLLLCGNLDLPFAHPLYLGLTSLICPGLLSEVPATENAADLHIASAVAREILFQKTAGLYKADCHSKDCEEKQIAKFLLYILKDYLMQYDNHLGMKKIAPTVDKIVNHILNAYVSDRDSPKPTGSVLRLSLSPAPLKNQNNSIGQSGVVFHV